ncbi:oligosaccharide flippase family protein [Photobacterium kishitanii]|uniref:oligosaccharide flippase family protein n=1 Tax=Photobacterium kishitanii TaxID=318456 RepID=UPI00071AF082|nr:oligosaccharide flippase family protein [Photobacterium kishitanii]
MFIINKITSHSVFKNTSALLILQIFNVLGPLVVLPFLTRILGVDKFGQYMIFLSISSLGIMIVDFGFNLSATYYLSKNIKNKNYISKYIASIYIIKAALVLIVTFTIYLYFFLKNETTLYSFIIGLNIISISFLPIWFFQAIEKMKNITIFSSCSKLIYVVSILLIINKDSSLYEILAILAVSNFLGLLLSLILLKRYKYEFLLPSYKMLINVFLSSIEFFMSRISVSLYTSACTFIIGSISGSYQSAIYSASEKLYQASQVITGSIAQALFPYMSKNNQSKILFKVSFVVGCFLSLGCLIISLYSNDIVRIIYGDEFVHAGKILNIFLIITVINFISVNYGYPAFSSINKLSVVNYSVVIGGFLQLISLYVLYINNSIDAYSVVISVLLTETIVMLFRVIIYIYIKRERHDQL